MFCVPKHDVPFTTAWQSGHLLLQVYGYCIFKNGEEAKLLYPKEGFEDDVSGRSFTHGRFVQRLRHAAASAPGVTARQGTVKRLINGEPLCCTLTTVSESPPPQPWSHSAASPPLAPMHKIPVAQGQYAEWRGEGWEGRCLGWVHG